jgi:hypothetical protein
MYTPREQSQENHPSAPVKRRHTWRNVSIALVGIVLLVIVSGLSRGNGPSELTQDHREAIERVHSMHAWTRPTHVEVSSVGFVVVEYEVPDGLAIPPRTFGETRLLAIRDALLPYGFKDFRVNVNAPSPGTGLVKRYGSARFIDGGSVEWLTP